MHSIDCEEPAVNVLDDKELKHFILSPERVPLWTVRCGSTLKERSKSLLFGLKFVTLWNWHDCHGDDITLKCFSESGSIFWMFIVTCFQCKILRYITTETASMGLSSEWRYFRGKGVHPLKSQCGVCDPMPYSKINDTITDTWPTTETFEKYQIFDRMLEAQTLMSTFWAQTLTSSPQINRFWYKNRRLRLTTVNLWGRCESLSSKSAQCQSSVHLLQNSYESSNRKV